MTKRDKLVERILQRPPTASFRDVKNLLEEYGWKHARTRGSHFTFTKANEYPLVIVVHDKRVKSGYLDKICKALGLEEETED